MATKLLRKQMEQVFTELSDYQGFSAGPLEDDFHNSYRTEHMVKIDSTTSRTVFHWSASIMGPENTAYEGGQFDLRIDFTYDYPMRPPKVWFLTKVFHPNVEKGGQICADFLTSDWKPSFSVSYVILAICSLLAHPNAETPAVQEIADIYLKNRSEFEDTARQWTKEYAKPRL